MKTKSFYKSYIPDDWTHPNFGSVFTFLKTFSFSREDLTYDETISHIQYIHYGDIHATFKNEVLDFEVEQSIPSLKDGLLNEELLSRIDFPYLKDGDLIIADASEDYEGVCKCVELKNIGKRKIISGLHTMAVRADESTIAYGFRTYALNHPQVIRELRRISTGISVYSVSKSYISNVLLPLPPISEQKNIASCLNTWDHAICTISHVIDMKEIEKKWLMQKILSGELRINGFNSEWKESRLGEMFLERIDLRNNGLQLLSIGQNGVYPQSESEKRDTSNEDKSKHKRICPGDIGYNTMRMWQGRSALSDLDGIVSPAYTIITPTEIADPLFFSYLFKTPKLMYLFWRNSQGLVDDTLNCKFKDFSRIKVLLPDKDEQLAIAKVLKTADNEINLLKTIVQKIREQKKGLMQVLLTGKKKTSYE